MNNPIRTLVGVLFATLLLLAAAGTALAQDVVIVSPETHRVLLENDQVRVLGVRVKPGEKVAMHSHPANVVYYLSDGKIRLSSHGGTTEDREVKAGTAIWSEGATHAVENVGTTEFSEVQIELKGPAKTRVRAKKGDHQ
jgi:quercetin dioxygenase-like cupin family protein